jgi:hypothetical protein
MRRTAAMKTALFTRVPRAAVRGKTNVVDPLRLLVVPRQHTYLSYHLQFPLVNSSTLNDR